MLPIARRSVLYALRSVAEQAEWLDVDAAARYLDFHPNTIYRMIREGRLVALRFPVRIRRGDLDACIERCRIKPGELAHLNAYAVGRGETKAGRPDRRRGPRQLRRVVSNSEDRAPASGAEPPLG